MPRSLLVFALLLIPFSQPALAFQAMPPRPLTPPTFDRASGGPPIVASNGNGFLAAWSGGTPSIMRISTSGQPAGPLANAIDVAVPDRASVQDLVSDGSNYLLVARTANAIRTIRIDADGNVLSSVDVLAISPAGVTAAVAWSGQSYLLVYFDVSNASVLNGIFLDRDGSPSSAPFRIMNAARYDVVAVASNGRDFVVAAEYTLTCAGNVACENVSTVPVRADGSVGAPGATLAAGPMIALRRRAIAWTGETYILVYTSSVAGLAGANEVPLNAAGQPTRGSTGIAVGAVRTDAIVATSAGAVALISYGNSEQAMRFDRQGDPVDAQPLPAFDWPATVKVYVTDAAVSADRVFGVWVREEQGAGSIADFEYGGVIDVATPSAGQPLASAADAETLAEIGTSDRMELALYLVKPPLQNATLFARRYVDGAAIEAPRPVLGPTDFFKSAAIAAHAGDFLVVTTENAPAVTARLFRNGAGVTPDLQLYAGSQAAPFQTEDRPFAFWTGSDFLVGWTRTYPRSNNGVYQRLMACHVGADGTLLTQPHEVNTGNVVNAGNARVVRTPGGLVAVFNQSKPVYSGLPTPNLSYDIWAVRTSTDGDFIGEPVRLAVSPTTAQITGVAADSEGDVFVSWVDSMVGFPPVAFQPAAHAEIFGPDLTVAAHIDFPDAVPRDVAWSGHSFAVAWNGSVQPYSARGVPISDPLRVAAGDVNAANTRIAPRGGGAFLAFAAPNLEESGSAAPRVWGSVILDGGRNRAIRVR